LANESTQAKLPRSLAVLGDLLKTLRPPTDGFDSSGAWEHRYAVILIVPEPGGVRVNANRHGWLRLQRQPSGDGTAKLDVSLAALQGGGGFTYRVDAAITCSTDRLAAPRAWELRWRTFDAQKQLVPDASFSETGAIRDGAIVRRRGNKERTMPAPKQFTGNWCLFDALQRLPNNTSPVAFDMLEELDLLKPEQRLSFRQTIEVELGGRHVRLHGFEQVGRGILPYTYWLDDHRRLLVATGGMRGYLWDPTAGTQGGQP
jgi:hypothetical protein